MNKWKRFIKQNWLASLVAGTFLLTCLALLYFKHPASPYHLRNQYILRFEQIGTLSPGNRVQVNGLTRGKILSAKLTDDAVFVTIEVLAHTPIPKNSTFRLINSGLMGEREVCILLGNSKEFLASGDTANGLYDEGTSGITRKLKQAFSVLDSIMITAEASLDSLLGGKNGERLSRITSKGNNIINETSSLISSSKENLEGFISSTENALQNAKGVLDNIKTDGSTLIENIETTKSELDSLLAALKNLKQKLADFSEDAPMPLIKEKAFFDAASKLSDDVENFRKDLIKNGLKINVDIF